MDPIEIRIEERMMDYEMYVRKLAQIGGFKPENISIKVKSSKPEDQLDEINKEILKIRKKIDRIKTKRKRVEIGLTIEQLEYFSRVKDATGFTYTDVVKAFIDACIADPRYLLDLMVDTDDKNYRRMLKKIAVNQQKSF